MCVARYEGVIPVSTRDSVSKGHAMSHISRSDSSTCFRGVVRMGQHAWLLLATVLTELLIIIKFGRGQFPESFPTPVKFFFGCLVFFLVAYPTVKVSRLIFIFPSLHGIHIGFLRSLGCLRLEGLPGKIFSLLGQRANTILLRMSSVSI